MDLTAPAIAISGMSKFYGTFQALRGISLTVKRGEKVVICGPSGSGKSTMIRCINQLEEHDAGDIRVFGTLLDDNIPRSTKSAAKWEWCFSTATCFRI